MGCSRYEPPGVDTRRQFFWEDAEVDQFGEELERLAGLLEAGHLSHEEYDSLKARLIGSSLEGRPDEVDEADQFDETSLVEEEKSKASSEPLPQQPAHTSDLAYEVVPPARYSIRGLGLTICWLSGIALIPLVVATISQFVMAALMEDLIDGSVGFDFYSYWSSVEDADLTAWTVLLPLYLVATVLLIIWSWRATKNIQAWVEHFGYKKLRRRPGWAIGGWFIPIGNLWIPYQTIKDAWERAPFIDGSGHRINGSSPNRAWLIAWLTWIATNLADRVVLRRYLSDLTPRDLRATYYLEGFSNIVVVVSVVCFIITVKKISERHAARLNL